MISCDFPDLNFPPSALIPAGRVCIANVHNGGHFVLAGSRVSPPLIVCVWLTRAWCCDFPVGYDRTNEDVVYVPDPGFDVSQYSYKKDIVGWRIFDFKA